MSNCTPPLRLVAMPELRDLIPPLSPEEFEQLEANLLSDGILDPIKIWKRPAGDIIIDGHNRWEIAKKHDLEFQTKVVFLNDMDEAKDWIDQNQLGRRNLTPDMQALLRGRIFNRSKQPHGGQEKGSKPQSEASTKTASDLAPQLGVSRATLERDGQFAEAVEKLDLGKEVAAGKVKAPRSEVVKKAKELPEKVSPKQIEKAHKELEEPKAPKAPKEKPIKAEPLAPDESRVLVPLKDRARLEQLERLLPEKEEEAKALRVEVTNLKVDKSSLEAKVTEMTRQLEEAGHQVQELAEENASLHRILDGDDLLASYQKEVQRVAALARTTEERFRGQQNQNKALAKSAESWKGKFDRLQKKTKGAPELEADPELEDECPYPPVEV